MNINELKANVTAIPGADGRALMIRDDSRLSVSLTAEAEKLRKSAMELAVLVGDLITTPEQQEVAVQAQIALKQALNECEKARKACKEPVLEFGRRIDAAARAFCARLNDEFERVSVPLRDYQAVLETRKRAEEALQLEKLEALDRQKQEELAKAQTVEQVAEIQERICEQVRAVSAPVEVPKAEGQIVRYEWEITVPNPHLLAKERPDCVRIEPDLRAIKDLLNAGVEIKSIKAKRVINSTVRTGTRQPKVLDVVQ